MILRLRIQEHESCLVLLPNLTRHAQNLTGAGTSSRRETLASVTDRLLSHFIPVPRSLHKRVEPKEVSPVKRKENKFANLHGQSCPFRDDFREVKSRGQLVHREGPKMEKWISLQEPSLHWSFAVRSLPSMVHK